MGTQKIEMGFTPAAIQLCIRRCCAIGCAPAAALALLQFALAANFNECADKGHMEHEVIQKLPVPCANRVRT